MRFAYAAIISLVVAAFLPYVAAAAQISSGDNVAAARIAAEQELISSGINPGDAVFQIGARNYVGNDCPGSGWNCTTASIVVQINSGIFAGWNSFNCTSTGTDTTGQQLCVVIQGNSTFTGSNVAHCVEHTTDNPALQRCRIRQETHGSATNSAFIDQRIFQSQAKGLQDARQFARVRQFNANGANESTVHQFLIQDESTSADGLGLLDTLDQTQEGHQDTDVCQGGETAACGNTTFTRGMNTSSVVQRNVQNARVAFDASTLGTITQNQNANPNKQLPTIIADLVQNTSDKTNESSLTHSSAHFATVHRTGERDDDEDAPGLTSFNGKAVKQTQGNAFSCDSYLGGVCGFINQNQRSIPALTTPDRQIARQRQNELLKAVGPKTPKTVQVQHGDEWCCATQSPLVGGNPNNINFIHQHKALRSTGTLAFGDVGCHFQTSGGGTCNQTLVVTGKPTQSNSCPGSPAMCSDQTPQCIDGHICNPIIFCTSGTGEDQCSKSVRFAPIPPPRHCDGTADACRFSD